MQIETNIHGNRIAYEYPYADTLNKHEKELYCSATQKAENSLSRIWKVQEKRLDEQGNINDTLLDDEFRVLREEMEELGEAITLLHLLVKSADWSERMAESRESLLQEMEAVDNLEDLGNE